MQEIMTAIDDLDSEDIKNLRIRRTIASVLNRDNLVDILRDIVDKSELIDFTSSRSRKFISGERPELNLVLDLDLAKDIQPKLGEETANDERIMRTEIIKEEIVKPVVNFFNAIFLYIKNGELDEELKDQEKRVHSIIGDKDLVELRDSIQNIIMEVDGEGNEEMTFMFSVIAGVRLAEDEDIFGDDTFLVELVY